MRLEQVNQLTVNHSYFLYLVRMYAESHFCFAYLTYQFAALANMLHLQIVLRQPTGRTLEFL